MARYELGDKQVAQIGCGLLMWWLFCICLIFGFWGTVGYVAWHFISKAW